jgi:chemotaxis protein histidine kinase CheA
VSEWSDTLGALRRTFVEEASGRLDRMERLLDALDDLPRDVGALRELERHFHSLGGAGGAFGFAEVTDSGRRGEEATGRRLAEGGCPSADDLAAWRGVVVETRAAVAGAAAAPAGEG